MKSDPSPEPLPAPSYAPPLIAAGLVLLLWGAVTHWILSAIGLILTGFASAQWIADLRPRRAWQEAASPAAAVRASALPALDRRATAIGGPAVVAHSVWVHRCALLLALCALAVVVTGSIITSSDRAAAPSLRATHLGLGALAGLLALYVCVRMRGVTWILVAVVMAEALLSGRAPAIGALHAFLAHLFFAGSVAAALVTSSWWKCDPEFADDLSKLSLRSVGAATVGLVLIQVALGAAVRHKLMGAGLHITFALVVALAIVCLGIAVMNHCPEHKRLRPCSILMMVVAGTQVFLGFSAFITGMMADQGTLPVVITSVAHVTTGALALGATVVLALELRRHLRARPAAKPAAV